MDAERLVGLLEYASNSLKQSVRYGEAARSYMDSCTGSTEYAQLLLTAQADHCATRATTYAVDFLETVEQMKQEVSSQFLEALKTTPPWNIEGVPEGSELCWIVTRRSAVSPQAKPLIAMYEQGIWWFDNLGSVVDDEVTHWMPISVPRMP